MSQLQQMVLAEGTSIGAIAAYLDALDPQSRAEGTRSLGPKAQRRLWRMCRGRALSVEDFVPADRGPLDPVIHYGRNTLPAFKLFEKRFCRPPEGHQQDVLWGYNEGATRALVGPGYFVCRPTPGDSRGEMVIDYYQVPPGRPDHWPRVRDNLDGISRFVYAEMHDFMRRVSEHVSIGRAYKRDRETPNCFTLCRAS